MMNLEKKNYNNKYNKLIEVIFISQNIKEKL